MLLRLIYTSRARGRPSVEALSEILATARRHNRAAGITGALVYCEGRYLQVLEGPDDAVEALFGRIRIDPRHTEIQTLHHAPAARQQFARWAMAFHLPTSTESVPLDHWPLEPDVSLSADEALNPTLAELVLTRLSTRMTRVPAAVSACSNAA